MPVEIIVLDETHLDRMGIYRIWFGWKYYIGATKNTSNRIIQHSCKISAALYGKGVGKNSQTKIARFLMVHPYVGCGFFELVEVIDDEMLLVDAEQKWLNVSVNDENCLNYTFFAYRKVNGIEIRPTIPYEYKKGGSKHYSADICSGYAGG